MIAKVGWRMVMESSAWSVTNMPECRTHQLWLPEQNEEWSWNHQHDHSHQHAWMHHSPTMIAEQDEEWTWNHQHDHSHKHARMHHSPAMIARAGWRMVMESSAWSQSPTCLDAQLTPYDCNRISNKDRFTHMVEKISRWNTLLPSYVETIVQACRIAFYLYHVWEMQTCVLPLLLIPCCIQVQVLVHSLQVTFHDDTLFNCILDT